MIIETFLLIYGVLCGRTVSGCFGSGAINSLEFDIALAKGYVNTLSGLQGDLSEGHLVDALNRNLKGFFGGDMHAEPLKFTTDSSTFDHLITCPKDLWCTFNEPCRWHHTTAVDLHFVNGTGLPSPVMLGYITGTTTLPDPPYAIAAGTYVNKAAVLISDPIYSYAQDVFVYFKYWSSPGVELRVCATKEHEFVPVNCSAPFRSGVGGHQGNIWSMPRKISTAFQIYFSVTNFSLPEVHAGILLLDDIRLYISNYPSSCVNVDTVLPTTVPPVNSTFVYHRPIQEEQIKKAHQSKGKVESIRVYKTPPLVPCASNATSQRLKTSSRDWMRLEGFDDMSMCKAVSCSFEGFDSCHYNLQAKAPLMAGNFNNFVLTTGSFKKINRGISTTDNPNELPGFLLASGSKKDKSPFLAVSGCFSIIYSKNVTFYRYQKGHGRLKICLSSLNNCVKTFDKDTNGKWELSQFLVTPTDVGSEDSVMRLIFYANVIADGYIAVDQIGITDECTE